MKASELIEKLKTLPPDTKIALAMDSEGNGFSLLSGDMSTCFWNEGEPDFETDGDAVVLWPK